MTEIKLAVEYACSRTSCTHPVQLRMQARVLLNAGVSVLKSRLERQVGIAVPMIQIPVAHGLHRDSAGQFPTFVPAHSVRDHGQAALFLKVQLVLRLDVTIVVLVFGAVTTDVRKICELNARTDMHFGSSVLRLFGYSVLQFFSSSLRGFERRNLRTDEPRNVFKNI